MGALRRYLFFTILLMSTVGLMSIPQGNAAGIGLPSIIYLPTFWPSGCAVGAYNVTLSTGTLLNIDMLSHQTVYLYLMSPQSFASWTYRQMCNSPGGVLLYETITKDLGYTLHWTSPYNGTVYFVFEYDSRIPPVAAVYLIDNSIIAR